MGIKKFNKDTGNPYAKMGVGILTLGFGALTAAQPYASTQFFGPMVGMIGLGFAGIGASEAYSNFKSRRARKKQAYLEMRKRNYR
jgi:hypothetical protein